jgi:hypothetical protein
MADFNASGVVADEPSKFQQGTTLGWGTQIPTFAPLASSIGNGFAWFPGAVTGQLPEQIASDDGSKQSSFPSSVAEKTLPPDTAVQS